MNALNPEEIENLEKFRHSLSIELTQAGEMINYGKALPLTHRLCASIRKIKNILAEAEKDGAEISHDAQILICADEAKRIFEKQISNYAHTLLKSI